MTYTPTDVYLLEAEAALIQAFESGSKPEKQAAARAIGIIRRLRGETPFPDDGYITRKARRNGLFPLDDPDAWEQGSG